MLGVQVILRSISLIEILYFSINFEKDSQDLMLNLFVLSQLLLFTLNLGLIATVFLFFHKLPLPGFFFALTCNLCLISLALFILKTYFLTLREERTEYSQKLFSSSLTCRLLINFGWKVHSSYPILFSILLIVSSFLFLASFQRKFLSSTGRQL